MRVTKKVSERTDILRQNENKENVSHDSCINLLKKIWT